MDQFGSSRRSVYCHRRALCSSTSQMLQCKLGIHRLATVGRRSFAVGRRNHYLELLSPLRLRLSSSRSHQNIGRRVVSISARSLAVSLTSFQIQSTPSVSRSSHLQYSLMTHKPESMSPITILVYHYWLLIKV